MTNFVPDFPRGVYEVVSKEENNPAINLFGLRFFSDQSVMELLEEFFLVLTSKKEIGNNDIDAYFPDQEILKSWAYEQLSYYPKAKLNLKLFSFLGSSRLETRHESHRQHCIELWENLKKNILVEDSSQKDDALILLNNLFLGYWGSGAQRTWCAQGFLPFCKSLLSSEIIWNASGAKDVESWEDALQKFKYSQHIILARGGELLYLQICNALSKSSKDVEAWLKETGRWDTLMSYERTPEELHKNLQNAFEEFFTVPPQELNDLADFINKQGKNIEDDDDPSLRKASCGWCPEESWHEGYLFAVELLRILQAPIDIMETVEMLQIACAMQLLRSLAAQSYRYKKEYKYGDGLSYRLLFSEIEEYNGKRKDLSQTSLADIFLAIHQALRREEIMEEIPEDKRKTKYQDADRRYGHKLYSRVGKSIGLIVPRRGGKARFVLTDKLLRFFVLSLVPTQRMTLERFKNNIANHFGFVFDESALAHSPDWQDRKEQLDLNAADSMFLERMLEASGMLITLSDSCSLVKNPFCKGDEK